MSRRRVPSEAARAVRGLFKRFEKGFKRKFDDVRRATATPSRTLPWRAPDPHAKPRGTRTNAHPTAKRAGPKRRENEAADVLSRHGYDVEQNPARRWNGKEPDYKIQDRYFDCLAPDGGNVDRYGPGSAGRYAIPTAVCSRRIGSCWTCRTARFRRTTCRRYSVASRSAGCVRLS